ncbi:MAG: hypothetical protein N2C14_08895, partial [Planctomycetales bacterium]
EIAALALTTLAVIAPGSPEDDDQAILAVRKRYAQALPRRRLAPRTRVSKPGEPLRVGFLSSFYHRRNWMKPVWGLINHHDRERVQVHLFVDSPEGRLEGGYSPRDEDQLHDVHQLSNDQAALRIASAGIDVLIDLNGYSRQNRLGVLAAGPAPVAVGWFNLYATTGMEDYDFLIGDDRAIPTAEEANYVERILRVSGSYLSFEVLYPTPDVAPPPCASNDFFTFGSLVSQYKIADEVMDAWATILREADGARLLLKNVALEEEGNREDLLARFAERGVAADRVLLEGPAEHYDFLQAYNRVDAALDSFPYNGGTTTTEAIWQGVPVLTFSGDRWASRTSATILQAGGLSEFVAANREEHIRDAVQLARDPNAAERLGELRRGMRDRLRGSQVCDMDAFAREMEELYLQALSEVS